MKKEIIIIVFIIAVITTLHIITQKWSGDFFESISEELTELEDKIVDENVNDDEINKMVDEVQDKWRAKYDILACFIEHDELEKVEKNLNGLYSALESKEKSDAVAELDESIFILRHIKEKYGFKIENVF